MPSNELDTALSELGRAVKVYNERMAEYNAPGYNGLRMGFGAVQHRVIEAARATAAALPGTGHGE